MEESTAGISNSLFSSSCSCCWSFGVGFCGLRVFCSPHHVFQGSHAHVSCPGGCFRKSHHGLEFPISICEPKKPGEPPARLPSSHALPLHARIQPRSSPSTPSTRARASRAPFPPPANGSITTPNHRDDPGPSSVIRWTLST